MGNGNKNKKIVGGSTTSGTIAQQAHHQSKVIKDFKRQQQAATTNKKGLAKFVDKHEKTLNALEKIGKGAGAFDPLTDSRNRPSSTGSKLSDPGADRNPYAVVRGDSDVLTKKERKKLDSYTA